MYATDRRRGAGDLGEESSVALPGVAGNRRTYARVCSGLASGAARTGNGVSVFAAAILYPAAAFTSWRDFRANLSPISLLAVGLVLFTTAFVAIVAHALTA